MTNIRLPKFFLFFFSFFSNEFDDARLSCTGRSRLSVLSILRANSDREKTMKEKKVSLFCTNYATTEVTFQSLKLISNCEGKPNCFSNIHMSETSSVKNYALI